MMNTNKILFRTTALSFVLFAMSCSDFLNKVPQGNLTQQDFPVTADEALLATTAVYSSVREWYYNSGGYPILDIMSDDASKGSNPSDQSSTIGPYDNFSITTSDPIHPDWW